MLTFAELKRREVVQWALAYLAGAWLIVEVLSHLADTWGLPGVLIRGLHLQVERELAGEG